MRKIDRYLNVSSGYFYFENASDETTVDRVYKLENQLLKDGYEKGTDEERLEFNRRWKLLYDEDIQVK